MTDADRKLRQRLQNHRIALGLPKAATLQEEAIETWFLLEWTLEHLPSGLAERALASLERRKARRAKDSSAGSPARKTRSTDGPGVPAAQALGNAAGKRARREPSNPTRDPAGENLDEEALERGFAELQEAELLHGKPDPFTGGL
jgi:hypothetical protein